MASLLHVLLWWDSPCLADDKGGCEISVAALDLPAGCDGLLHWSEGKDATTPLQLSKRYFSEPVKLTGKYIQFYGEALPPGESAAKPRPVPLFASNLPEDTRFAYVLLSSVPDAQGQTQWRGNVLRGEDWKAGCLRVFNAGGEPVGIAAGTKRIPLAEGKSFDFQAHDWSDPFPAKIFRVEPKSKLLFSSTWRVTPGRRELVFHWKQQRCHPSPLVVGQPPKIPTNRSLNPSATHTDEQIAPPYKSIKAKDRR